MSKQHSEKSSVIFLKESRHLITVSLHTLHVVSHAEHSLVNIVVSGSTSSNEALLKLESSRVPVFGIHAIESSKHSVPFGLFADENSFIVRHA